MASGTGINTSRMPTRIMPPAMPKMPDRNEVPTIARHSAEISSGGMGGVLPPFPMILIGPRNKLSYRGLSISFLDGKAENDDIWIIAVGHGHEAFPGIR